MALADGVSFIAASSGGGTFVFGSARSSYLTLAQAQAAGEITDGQIVSYLAVDSLSAPVQREWGHGTYSLAGNSVARTTVLKTVDGSTPGSSALNFSVAPTIFLTALAEDFWIPESNGLVNLQHAAVGNVAVINPTIGSVTTDAILNLQETVTADASLLSEHAGLEIFHNYTHTGVSSSELDGVFAQPIIQPASTGPWSEFHGILAIATNEGSGAVVQLSGGQLTGTHQGSGTVSFLRGCEAGVRVGLPGQTIVPSPTTLAAAVYAEREFAAGSAIGTAAGVYVQKIAFDDTGNTITNSAGVLIQDQTVFLGGGSATITNNYNIWSQGGSALNQFDGIINLGLASSNTGKLEFTGTTTGIVTLSVRDAAGTWTMKLPTTAGTSGYSLTTDGSGNTSWTNISGGSGVTVDTLVNILGATPSSGAMAYATDFGVFLVADGAQWNIDSSWLTPKPDADDIGLSKYNNRLGYGKFYISDQSLVNCTIGLGTRSAPGQIRFDTPNNVLALYNNGVWQPIPLNVELRENQGQFGFPLELQPVNQWLKVFNGDSELFSLNGLPVTRGYHVDIGAYAAPQTVSGGTF